MRSVRKLLIPVVLAALLVGGVGVARPPGPGPSVASAAAAAPPAAFVLKLTALNFPASVGAVNALHGDVLDPADRTKKIGEAGGDCGLVKIEGTTPTVLCNGIFRLDGQGDIHIAALWSILTTYPYTFSGVISGGTGSYLANLGRADFTTTELGTFEVKLTLVQPVPGPAPSPSAR